MRELTACAYSMQVFVANPNKPQPIIDILANNKEKLLKYLEDFHTDKGEDMQLSCTMHHECISLRYLDH